MSQTQEGQLKQLDPKTILADPKDNLRFGLRPTRVKELASQITELGGVMEPVEVTPLVPPQNGFEYRLNYGYYRHAAVLSLNEQGAGLTLPAIVHTSAPGIETAKRNLIENIGREDLTLMDTARAIKYLLDNGMEKMEVRERFARPGRKGPVSNSWINTTVGFLDLPKAVQNKIHNGEITWDGARELVKVGKENKEGLAAVVAELEEERKKMIAKEEKEEEKFLLTLKKASDSEQKAKEAEAKLQAIQEAREKKLQDARDMVAKTEKHNGGQVAQAEKALQAATEQVRTDPAAGAKAVAVAAKALETTKRICEKTSTKAAEELKRLEEKYAEEDKDAEEKEKAHIAQAKLDSSAASEAKKAKQPGGTAKQKESEKPVSAKEVSKAAAKAGAAGAGVVKLPRKDIMEIIEELALPGGQGKAERLVQETATYFKACFDGHGTKNTLYKKLLALYK